MTDNSCPIALVTGSIKRLGAAIVRDLAAHGFQIAIHTHQDIEAAKDLAQEIQESGGTASVFVADLSETFGKGLIEDVYKKMGPVRLLINNASLFMEDHIGQLDAEIWKNHFALHTAAPVFLSQTMAQLLPKDLDGLIINMIDQRVWKLNPQFFSYTLSKSALWTATRTLAQALAPRIRVNAIGPGPSLKSVRQTEDDFKQQTQSVPLGHGPALSEFGETVRYFWAAKSVTGQMIALDGGQHLNWQTPDITGATE